MSDDDQEPQPSLKPTSPATLFVAALATGALMLVLSGRVYPPIPDWYTPATLLILALALGYTGHTTKARIARKPGAKPVEALTFARFAALAKASAVGGALITGAYAGALIYLVTHSGRLAVAAEDLPVAWFGFFASLALVAAGLWLERACRIPPEDDDKQNNGPNTIAHP